MGYKADTAAAVGRRMAETPKLMQTLRF